MSKFEELLPIIQRSSNDGYGLFLDVTDRVEEIERPDFTEINAQVSLSPWVNHSQFQINSLV